MRTLTTWMHNLAKSSGTSSWMGKKRRINDCPGRSPSTRAFLHAKGLCLLLSWKPATAASIHVLSHGHTQQIGTAKSSATSHHGDSHIHFLSWILLIVIVADVVVVVVIVDVDIAASACVAIPDLGFVRRPFSFRLSRSLPSMSPSLMSVPWLLSLSSLLLTVVGCYC